MALAEIESHLTDLVQRRDALKIGLENTLLAAQRAGRNQLLPSEERATADVQALNERIDHLSSELARGGGPALSELSARVNANANRERTAMPRNVSDFHLTYRKGDHSVSWVRDLMRHTLNMDDTGESRGRLFRHAEEVASDAAYMEFRDLNRTDGSGGYAVPPAWLMNQYIELARPGRPFANVVQRQPLPGGTDSINIPKLITGTSVAVQTADNAAIADVDLTDTFINAPVRTIAGQEGVAIQLIDQSPIAFDDVIFRDLVAAHAAVVDQECLDGPGVGGHVTGVDYTANVPTVTVSAMTIAGVYSAIANAIQTVHTQRFLPPEVVVMHPRRWGWLLSLLDTTNRPLFIPNAAQGPFNAAGLETAVASQQVVGTVQGLPVVTDPNISTTNGPFSPSGSDDLIYVTRASDLVLWESGIRARVLPEPKSANLTVVLQIFSYIAFSAARYPQSTVIIDGLSAPTW